MPFVRFIGIPSNWMAAERSSTDRLFHFDYTLGERIIKKRPIANWPLCAASEISLAGFSRYNWMNGLKTKLTLCQSVANPPVSSAPCESSALYDIDYNVMTPSRRKYKYAHGR